MMRSPLQSRLPHSAASLLYAFLTERRSFLARLPDL